MGGGGGGGGSFGLTPEQRMAIVNARIRRAVSERSTVLFVCHPDDAGELNRRIETSRQLQDVRCEVKAEERGSVDAARAASFIVFVGSSAAPPEWHDRVVGVTAALGRQMLATRLVADVQFAPLVRQNRVEERSWDELCDLLSV